MTDKEQKQQINKAWIVAFAGLGAIFRAFWGGSFFYCWRWIKYLFGVSIVLLMYWSKGLLNYKEIFTSWQWCVDNWRILAVCVSFMYHWQKGHGDYFKVNNTDPDEARIKWIDWLLQKIYGKGNYYNWSGNVTGLFIRYTFTSIFVAMSIPSYWAISMGIVVALTYGLCGKIFKNGYYTKWAEYLSGAFCFSILYCLL